MMSLGMQHNLQTVYIQTELLIISNLSYYTSCLVTKCCNLLISQILKVKHSTVMTKGPRSRGGDPSPFPVHSG